MTKKNMFRVAAVLMACVMILSCMSFATVETDVSVHGEVTYACSAGLVSASASTSCVSDAAYCFVAVDASYGATSRAIGGTYATMESSSGQGYGLATAGVSYTGVAGWAIAESEHRAPGCSGTLRDSFGV